MRPKDILQSLRRKAPPPSGAKALVPLGKHAKPMLSGQVNLLVLGDTSPSLLEYARRVRDGCLQVADQIRRDAWLAERAGVSIWALGEDSPGKLLVDWTPASRLEMPELPCVGHTPLCGAVSQALDHAVNRRETLAREHAADEAMNLVLVMSDFMPTDSIDNQALMEASLRRAAEAGVKLILLTVGDVDEHFAKSIAQPERPPVPLESVDDFTAFFKALGRSIRQCSVAAPGAPLQLTFQGRSLRMD